MAANDDSQDGGTPDSPDSISEEFDEDQFLYRLPKKRPKSPYTPVAEKAFKEIESQTFEKRELLKVQFSKKRKDFGAPLHLHDKENDLLTNIASLNDNLFVNYVRKRVNEIGLEAAKKTEHKSAQCNWAKMISVGVETVPEDEMYQGSESQNKQTADKLLGFLKKAGLELEKALTLNETVNIFADDFALVHDDEDMQKMSGATELSIIREIKSFEYPDCKKKSISCIRFQPSSARQKHQCLATSFVENLTFDERVEISGRSYKNQILMWDYKDMHLFTPVIILVSQLEILTFESTGRSSSGT